ncbi:probable terpene synthase 2 [Arachis duranensis]|uniref:Probable terpene synthase 2 n=1 Tax=Arachis duranensis TaxID=130453 RepID=A0A6P4DJ06_ARADU|nr:probable terpene synthase 2 [Arachis duranensis]
MYGVAASTLSCFNHNNANFELHEHARHTADFHPSIWKDYFLEYASEPMQELDHIGAQIETLKQEVTKMLTARDEKPLAKLNLIDSICRLGLHYHFECEVDEVLQQIHKDYTTNGEINHDDNLASLALLFRLLRQQGFYVSPNVFKRFKDVHGNFNEKLATDVEGLLSLYEASHLRIHGENILDEALVFTSIHLKSITTQLSTSLSAKVNRGLSQPLHHGLPRFEARKYISIYEQDPTHDKIILSLAKLDFNFLQNLYQMEAGNICKWWKELDVPRKLPFVRDRIVECYYWSLGVYFEPQFCRARKIMTKTLGMLSIIDDTYDAYGTIDELELFTQAIERWDISCLDDLPEYMRLSYSSLLKFYEEMAEEMEKERRVYCTDYYQKQFKKVVQAYMGEARWFNNNYTPTTEDYIHTSTISCTYPLLTTASYIEMEEGATQDIFKWVASEPKIVKASSIICRIMDDIVSNEFEQERGHVVSVLECYMKEHGVSREEAIQESQKRVTDAWKDINEECLRPTQIPMPFLVRVVNLARYMAVMYKDENSYTHAGGVMKEHIEALLVDLVPI